MLWLLQVEQSACVNHNENLGQLRILPTCLNNELNCAHFDYHGWNKVHVWTREPHLTRIILLHEHTSLFCFVRWEHCQLVVLSLTAQLLNSEVSTVQARLDMCVCIIVVCSIMFTVRGQWSVVNDPNQLPGCNVSWRVVWTPCYMQDYLLQKHSLIACMPDQVRSYEVGLAPLIDSIRHLW